MTELDEPFRGVDGDIKSSIGKLITISGLLPRKTIESLENDFERSYK